MHGDKALSVRGFVKSLQKNMMEIVVTEAIVFTVLGHFIPHFKSLKPTVPYAVFLMMLQPMFAINLGIILKEWKRKLSMMILVLLLYSLIYPLLTWGFLELFTSSCGNPIVIAGAVLTALAPVATPAPIVVASLEGDLELSVLSVIVTFLASLIVIPTWGYIILHKTIPVPVSRLLLSIAEFVVLPLIVGKMLRYIVEKFSDYDKVNIYLMGISLMAMYYLIALIFALSSGTILSMIVNVVIFMAMVYVYYALRHGLAYAIGKAVRASPKELIALTFVGTANGALGMAISLGAYGPSAAAGAVLAGPLGVLVTMSLVAKLLGSKASRRPSE